MLVKEALIALLLLFAFCRPVPAEAPGLVTTSLGAARGAVPGPIGTGTASLTGRVIEPGGASIRGAEVWIDGSPSHLALTDDQGAFRIPSLPLGIHTLAVRARGHETDFVPGCIANDTRGVEVVLRPVACRSEKVLVILVDFPDIKAMPGHDHDYFRRILFSGEPGAPSLQNYVHEVSRGRIDLECAGIVGWLTDTSHPHSTHEDGIRGDVATFALKAANAQVDFRKLDEMDNRTGAPGPDGKVDHVLIVTAGHAKSITGKKDDLNPVVVRHTEYLDGLRSTQQLLIPEDAPLGNFAHEFFHDMGEMYVQDNYLGGSPPQLTTEVWDLMNVGMYNPLVKVEQPYFENLGFLPAYPVPWTVRSLWYHGRMAAVVGAQEVLGKGEFTRTLHPWERGGPLLQRLLVKANSTAWFDVTVRMRLGFDRGLTSEGVLVSLSDPALAGTMPLRGPVRVRDATPGSPEPTGVHVKDRWQLDDAPFLAAPGPDRFREGPLDLTVLLKHADGSFDLVLKVRDP